MHIERAAVADVDDIQHVLRETWMDTYGPFLAPSTLAQVTAVWHDQAVLIQRVQDPTLFFAVSRDDRGEMCGLVTATRRNEHELFIYRLYVRPGFQHHGVGTALLNETLAAYPGTERVVLQVVADNKKGFAFWQKHGFSACGTREELVAGERITVTEMEKVLG